MSSPERSVKHGTARLAVAAALGLTLFKAAAFLLTGSVAMLASAADSLMDAFASGVNFLAIRYADRPPDASHRFGHGKAEAMAGLFQSLVVAGSAAGILLLAARRLLEPRPLARPVTGILVMGVSFAVTFLLVLRMRRVAAAEESLALEADSLHYVGDILANAGVILALAAYRWLGAAWPDLAVSLVIAGILLAAVWKVLRASLDVLMDRELPEEERARIVRVLDEFGPGLLGFHDLRTRRSGSRRFVDVHVEIDREATFEEAHRIAEAAGRAVERALPRTQAIVHADPVEGGPDQEEEAEGGGEG